MENRIEDEDRDKDNKDTKDATDTKETAEVTDDAKTAKDITEDVASSLVKADKDPAAPASPELTDTPKETDERKADVERNNLFKKLSVINVSVLCGFTLKLVVV